MAKVERFAWTLKEKEGDVLKPQKPVFNRLAEEATV